ncbi:GlxA family transcriptional regulator [Streptomyces antimicrobicus]|uniref:Helix-turn-helix domain-containing protein n=1 Tax=Streptomyces antimicrobicus TaxID=2883108 RepID=A0ABS8BBK6_9ACTN|nr:helix-turn-helix domain-containing protein [Streptomyces antimicrobicus]MCB5181990.1 helix-turn-helix domain-containing protein [Streptomyces antimicrobicus]
MRISVLVMDDLFDSGLATVLDVLQMANELREELPHPPPRWELTRVSGRGAVRTASGHVVEAQSAGDGPRPDLLVVPGAGPKQPAPLLDWVASPEREPEREALRRARAEGIPLAAACTSTFLLAEAGVLDGLTATTSWWLAPAFRQAFPQVALAESHMLVHAPGVTTAGAAMAHLDLALALVRQASPALADLTARYLVVDDRPTQAGYAIPSHLARTDPTVSAFESWVRAHLDQPLRMADAARAVGASERTLQRAVDKVLGVSPLRFAQTIRLEQAAHLLRTTDLPTEAVARRVGYENASTLTTLLRKRLGATPGHLRNGTAPAGA